MVDYLVNSTVGRVGSVGRVGRRQWNDSITLLSFDLWRDCYIKNVVLFEENSILPLPGSSEASGVESVWGEVSQESPKNRKKSVKISLVRA